MTAHRTGGPLLSALLPSRDQRLRRLLRHVQQQVPHAAELFRRAGLAADDIRHGQDLQQLPLTSKADRQSLPLEALLARSHRDRPLIDRSTSGSTGQRTVVRRTWLEERLLNLYRWKALSEYGLRPGARLAVVDFHDRMDPVDTQLHMRWARRLALLDWCRIDALAPGTPEQHLLAFRPTVITGMASAIARMVHRLASEPSGLGLARLTQQLRFVVPTGELLTPPLRATLGQLGVPVHDLYGCNETNLVAWACPSGCGLYHVCDDALVVEIVRPDGRAVAEGEVGEVVVTSLLSWSMPFVRYRVGDLAVRGPERCGCGRAGLTLAALQGRTIDTFPLPDGTALHPWEILNAIRREMGWIRSFQLVQTRPDRLELRIWPHRRPESGETSALLRAAGQVLAGRAGFTLALQAPGTPATTPGGKLRPFIPWPASERAAELL